jgi:hypothetical protein
MVATVRVQPGNLVTPDQRRVFNVVNAALMGCLGLGIAEVQRVCNEERVRRLQKYGVLPPEDRPEPTMRNITAARAIDELTLPFVLLEPPDPIVVDFQYGQVRELDAAQADNPTSMGVTIAELHLCVFMDTVDVATLCQRHQNFPLYDLTFHEFLHLCGDSTRNSAIDGVVRHNLCGIDPIAARFAQP